MKRTLISLLLLLSSAALRGGELNDDSLLRYLGRSFPNCPGGQVFAETTNQVGPPGFAVYRVTQRSADSRCGRATWALVASASGQILIADVFPLKPGPSTEAAIRNFATERLKKTVMASIDTQPLGDGIRRVRISNMTPYGVFSYGGFVDADGRLFMVGRRGNRFTDPGKTLLDDIGASNAARRGAKKGKVEIVELSDFQCPTCARAHEMFEPLVKKNLDKISYARLDLPLFETHDWAFKAAMTARAVQKFAPAKYWEFVDYVFSNQKSIDAANLDTLLKGFAEDHEIDWRKIDSFRNSQEEKQKLLDQVGRFYDAGVLGTPTFIVNGQLVHYGNEGDHVKKVIEAALK